MEKLKDFLENLFYLTEIPCSVWNMKEKEWIWSIGQKAQCITAKDFVVSEDTLHGLETQRLPYVIAESDKYYYGLYRGDDHMAVILGPIALIEPTVKEKNDYIKRYQIQTNVTKITVKTIFYLARTLAIIYNYNTGQNISIQDIFNSYSENNMMQEIDMENEVYSLENSEKEKENLSFFNTQKLKNLIMQGDCDALEKAMDSFENEHMGVFTASLYKRYEYMAVTSVSIHVQAAVEGGVPSSIAYDLSDIYCRRIEACHTIDEIMQLMNTMSKDYTMRVKEFKEQRKDSAYLEKIKYYIMRNVEKPICLEDIAAYIQLDKFYVSRIFYKKEGMHLQEYIHRERIRAACNMLKYSDVPIADIASNLCFYSQSHFGTVFKKHQKMTPKQYRNQNQIC